MLVVISLLVLSACSNEQADFSVSSSEVNSNLENNQASEVSNQEEKDSNFYGDLQVEGTHVTDSDGNVVQLNGVSTHGINWFPDYVNYQLFEQIKENTDINTIRIALYTEDYNGYLNTDSSNMQKQLDLIDDAIEYAEALDMYVIIDWHILSDSNPLDHTAEAVEFFTTMSEEYGDSDNVIFEICNEPNGDTTWEDITAYANEVIPVIRENSDNLIIVGTPTWSQDVDVASQAPLEFDNIVYTLHFYAGSHKQELRDKAQTAIDNGLPLFVSEFGISDASGNGAIDTQSADEWIEFLDDNQISYVMWNLSNKDESSALIKSDVTSTTNLTLDDLTESGQWYLEQVSKDKSATRETESNSQVEKESTSVDITIDDETWNNGGKYTFDIANNSSQGITDYQLTVTFNQDIKVTDNWNCEVVVDGNEVVITPVDYNSTIPADGQVEDLGIIIETDGQAEVEATNIEY